MENQNSLEIIKKHTANKDLVYVKPEDLQTQKMFIPQVTVLNATPADFHDKTIGGKMMPRGHHVDRIGEAAGIVFIAAQCGTRKEGERIWVGRAQGKRRMPDGTWRESTVNEYEFDAETRAKQDSGLKEGPALENKIIELCRFGRQRASTGARLRVIRELTGIPITFSKEDFLRAVVVSRIDINSDAMLEDPKLSQAAIAHALEGSGELFGPTEPVTRNVTPAVEAIPAPVEDSKDEPDIFGPDQGTSEVDDAVAVAKTELENWLDSGEISKPANRAGIQALIADPDVTIERLTAALEATAKAVAAKKAKEAGSTK